MNFSSLENKLLNEIWIHFYSSPQFAVDFIVPEKRKKNQIKSRLELFNYLSYM